MFYLRYILLYILALCNELDAEQIVATKNADLEGRGKVQVVQLPIRKKPTRFFIAADAPVGKVLGRAASCVYDGKKYKNGEIFDFWTTSTSPKYGFKMKCNDGVSELLGCYENEDLYVEKDKKTFSKVYPTFTATCTTNGIDYTQEAACEGHKVNDVFNDGFYKYKCSAKGLEVLSCINLDGKPQEIGSEFDALGAYRMKCSKTSRGLLVEAIACYDDDKALVPIGQNKVSGFYRRKCEEVRENGLQTAVSLNIIECCEQDTNHCIKLNEEEPSVLFPQLKFQCIKRDTLFTYRYVGAGNQIMSIPPSMFPSARKTASPVLSASVSSSPIVSTRPSSTMQSTRPTLRNSTSRTSLVSTATPKVVEVSQPALSTQLSQKPNVSPTPKLPDAVTKSLTPNLSSKSNTATPQTAPQPTKPQPSTIFVTVTTSLTHPPVIEQPTRPQPTVVTVTQTLTPPTPKPVEIHPTQPETQVLYVTVTRTLTPPTQPIMLTTGTPPIPVPTPLRPSIQYVTVTQTLTLPTNSPEATVKPTKPEQSILFVTVTQTLTPPLPPSTPAPTQPEIEHVATPALPAPTPAQPEIRYVTVTQTLTPPLPPPTQAPTQPESEHVATPELLTPTPAQPEIRYVTVTQTLTPPLPPPTQAPTQPEIEHVATPALPTPTPAEPEIRYVTLTQTLTPPLPPPTQAPTQPEIEHVATPALPTPTPAQPEIRYVTVTQTLTPQLPPPTQAPTQPEIEHVATPALPTPTPAEPEIRYVTLTQTLTPQLPTPTPAQPEIKYVTVTQMLTLPTSPTEIPIVTESKSVTEPVIMSATPVEPQIIYVTVTDVLSPPTMRPDTKVESSTAATAEPVIEPPTVAPTPAKPNIIYITVTQTQPTDDRSLPTRENSALTHATISTETTPLQPAVDTEIITPTKPEENVMYHTITKTVTPLAPPVKPTPVEPEIQYVTITVMHTRKPPPTTSESEYPKQPDSVGTLQPSSTSANPDSVVQLATPSKELPETNTLPFAVTELTPVEPTNIPAVTSKRPQVVYVTVIVSPTVPGRTDGQVPVVDPWVIPEAAEKCPEGWLQHKQDCIKMPGGNKTTVYDAEKDCVSDGAQLLVIHSQDEWIFVTRQLDAMRKLKPAEAFDGYFIGLKLDAVKNDWQWNEPTGLKPIPWLPAPTASGRRKRQAMRDQLRRCAEIRWNGEIWGIDQEHCTHKQGRLCDMAMPKALRPTVISGVIETATDRQQCTDGWVQLSENCYFISKPNSRVDITDAQRICKDNGGSLVTVSDDREWAFLTTELENRKHSYPDEGMDGFWVGYTLDSQTNKWGWLKPGGLAAIPWLPEKLAKVQAKAINASNFVYGDVPGCGEIRSTGDRWGMAKDHCLHKQGYICKKDISEAPGDCRNAAYACPASAECVTTASGNRCVCKVGYLGDGYSCHDIDECATGKSNCSANSVCRNTQGSYNCYCLPGYAPSANHGCEEYGTCVTYGDPHYLSFDGSPLDYQGSCRYTLVQSNPLFRIDARSEARNNVSDFTWTRDIYAQVYDHEYGLLKGGVVTVNGVETALPYTLGNNLVAIRRIAAGHTHLQAQVGFNIMFDGQSRGEVQVMGRYKGKVAGLCGNYNGNKTDDWTTPDGTLTSDPNHFGNGWLVPNVGDQGKNCTILGNNTGLCAPGTPGYRVGESFCKPLIDQNGELFKCLQLTNTEPNTYYHSCVIDVCATGSQAACLNFANVAQTCTEKGQPPKQWRSLLSCPGGPCGENQEFKECGSACPKTCADVLAKKEPSCVQHCESGCFCKDGFVQSNDRCIKPEECGCTMGGEYFQVNSTFFTESCRVRCVCTHADRYGPRTDCSIGACDHHAHCVKQTEKIDKCACAIGYTGNGVVCSDLDECKLNIASCSPDTECTNFPGSYACLCKAGYRKNLDGVCVDVNECTELSAPCVHVNAICMNVPGSYLCTCPKGYLVKETKRARRQSVAHIVCEDIDECSTKTDDCDPNTTTCTNTAGSYLCECLQGNARINSRQCKQIATKRPSEPLPNVCHERAQRLMTENNTSCICLSGYRGDGILVCDDVDECKSASSNPCGQEASCVNTPGSVRCECKIGFRNRDSLLCEDIDECLLDTCPSNSPCVNTYGSYTCGPSELN